MKLPFYGVGVDLPHLVYQIWAVRVGIKICEIAVLQGVDLPHLVCQIWAVRIGIKICEIDVLQGVDLPHLVCQIWAVQSRNQNLWNCCSMGGRSATPGWPNMSCQNRNQNLKLPFYGVGVDLPHLVCQICALRIGIKLCEIAVLQGGRSATPGWPNMSCQNRNQNLWNCHLIGCHSTGVDLPHLVSQICSCQNRNQNLWNCCSTGVDLPHLVSQICTVRIGIKICEIVILWGGGRSATPGLPNMSCQSRNQNMWNCCSTGGRSATPGSPNMSCQNRNQNLWNCCSTGVDLPHLVSQIWAVRIGIKICEIAVLQGLDLPHLVCQIWAVRIGIKICEIAILWGGGRSATPGLPNMSCQNRNQNLWNCCSTWGGVRSATPGLPNMSCQNRNQNLWNCHSMGWG